MRRLPSKLQADPDYIRIQYLRYADDWILGVIGPKELAVSLRDEVQTFLRAQLRLELSLEKTRITHAKSEDTFCLGAILRVGKEGGTQAKVISRKTPLTRPFRQRVSFCNATLMAPIKRLIGRLHGRGFCEKDGYPTAKRGWAPLDVDQIVILYNSILRGLLNYYRFANNFARLGQIQYVLRFSLAKTLACKFRLSMSEVFRKQGRNLHYQWELPDGRTRQVRFAENTDWAVDLRGFATTPVNIELLAWQTHLRTKSKLGFPCLVCGCARGVEMHHVRHVRKLGAAKPKGFTAVMARLNRKQVPVGQGCHRKIHRGEYDGISLSDLAYDFVARPV